jgi:hypothetical protein
LFVQSNPHASEGEAVTITSWIYSYKIVISVMHLTGKMNCLMVYVLTVVRFVKRKNKKNFFYT